MRYIGVTQADRRTMLQKIGAKNISDLFAPIPEKLRLQTPLALPPPLSELELTRVMRALADKNTDPLGMSSFMGAGAYNHFIPAAIHQLLLRGEFLTAYTAYQPEGSQGTLQAIYEFQTFIAMLTGMDIANGSMYDGATAAAEAVLMARRVNSKATVLISGGLHPDYVNVIRTCTEPAGTHILSLELTENGTTDFVHSYGQDRDISAVVVGYPNFFGVIEDLRAAREFANQVGALLIVIVTEPIALGVLKPPGAFDADIVAGEGQAMGIPVSFGGPYLGLFATKQKYMRQMPGRLVGKAKDIEGRDGYVITLATREQHIRRERATSNICTNETLLAIGATIFLSLAGPEGLREIALQNVQKARYARNAIAQLSGYTIVHAGPTFNEFLVRTENISAEVILSRLHRMHIYGGVALSHWFTLQKHDFLVCVTECNSRAEIDALVRGLAEAQE